MNLKEELKDLVSQHQVNNGVLDKLVDNAYEHCVLALKSHAYNGRSSADIEVTYPGCKGGYSHFFERVRERLMRKLTDEGLRADKRSQVQGAIHVSW